MSRHSMDDSTAERLLRGAVPSDRPELEPLAVLLSQVRDLGDVAPKPTASLYALLRDGFEPGAAVATAPPAAPARSSLRRRLAAVAGLSLTVKVLAGTGVAVAGVATAAGTGVLPDPVQDRVSSVVSTLTPFDLESRSDAPTAPERQTPDRPQVQLPPAVDEAPRAEPELPEQAPIDEPPRTAPEQRPEPAQPDRRSERAPERPEPAPAPQERARDGATPPRGEAARTQQATPTPAAERPDSGNRAEGPTGADAAERGADGQTSAASLSNTGASRSR